MAFHDAATVNLDSPPRHREFIALCAVLLTVWSSLLSAEPPNAGEEFGEKLDFVVEDLISKLEQRGDRMMGWPEVLAALGRQEAAAQAVAAVLEPALEDAFGQSRAVQRRSVRHDLSLAEGLSSRTHAGSGAIDRDHLYPR